MSKNIRQEKAITLVALVVTIVVLLILAGVAISNVIGNNGLIGKSINAKAASAYYSGEEQVRQAFSSVKMQIMEISMINSSYDATKTSNPDNLSDLVNIVKEDLNASNIETEAPEEYIVTTDTSNSQNPSINIKYKNPKIKKDSISEGKPSKDGQAEFKIKITRQDAELITNARDDLLSFTIDGVTYNAEKGMDWEAWATSEYASGLTVVANYGGLLIINSKYITLGLPSMPGPRDPPPPVQGLPYNVVWIEGSQIPEGGEYYSFSP